MEQEQIYEGLDTQELLTLQDAIIPHLRNWYVYDSNGDRIVMTKAWLAIYKDWLVSKDMQLELDYSKYYFRQEDLDTYYPTNSTAMRFAKPFDEQPASGRMIVHFINTTTGVKIYDYIKKLIETPTAGFIDKPGVAVSLTQNKTHRVKVLVNNRVVFVITNQINHKFVQQTLALLPFILDDEQLKQQNVLECCKAVANNTTIKPFVSKILEAAKNARQQEFLNCIKGTLDRRRNENLNKIRDKIKRIKDNITSYETTIRKEYEKLEEAMHTEVGIIATPTATNENIEAILEFTDKNPYIVNVETRNGSYSNSRYLCITTLAPITFYEPEPLQNYINNKFREEPYMTNTHKQVLKVLEEVFCKEKYTMYCKTIIKIDTEYCKAAPRYNDTDYSLTDYDYMIQPHLYLYGCWGENETNIRNEIQNGDLLSAFQLIILAIQNINFTDYTVLRNFISYLKDYTHLREIKTFKSKEDGQWYSLKDIVEKIKEQVAEEQAAQEEVGHPELRDEIPNF